VLSDSNHCPPDFERGSRGIATTQIEAIPKKHEAIEELLKDLETSIVHGASPHTILEILNASVAFCRVHFADEEALMRESGHPSFEAHAAAHKQLLAGFESAQRLGQSREGLPLAMIDAIKLLHVFHQHVGTYDRSSEAVADAWAISVQ
jgi:hemerythrin-like metal-binding protein